MTILHTQLVPCPYCRKSFKDEERVNRHIAHTPFCKLARERRVAELTAAQRLYDPYDPEDVPQTDEGPPPDLDYNDCSLDPVAWEELVCDVENQWADDDDPEGEGVVEDGIAAEGADDDATNEDQLEDNSEVNRTDRLSVPVEVVYAGAAQSHGRTLTKFESRRREELRTGDHSWGPLKDEVHFEIAQWLIESGVSQSKMDSFFHTSLARKCDLKWKNVRSFLRSIDELDHGTEWKCRLLPIPGDLASDGTRPTEWVELWYRDVLEVHEELLGNPLLAADSMYAPTKVYTDASQTVREYGEAMTGEWAWKTQDKLPNGATLDPVIFASDETQLSQFTGDHSAWPVYTSSGIHAKAERRKPSTGAQKVVCYLPVPTLEHIKDPQDRAQMLHTLFHDCMTIVTAPLIHAGNHGKLMVCGDGYLRLVFPVLMSYVADFPEQCLVACCRQSHCFACDANHKNRGDLPPRGAQRVFRSQESVVNAIDIKHKTRRANSAYKQFGLKPVLPFYTDLPHVELATLFTPDLLHQLHKGCFRDHLATWFSKILSSAVFDANYKAMSPFPSIRHFKKGITGISQWTGKEYKDMAKVFVAVISGSRSVNADMQQAALALLDFTYLSQLPCHTDRTLHALDKALQWFHQHKDIFTSEGHCLGFHGIPKFHSIEHYGMLIFSKGSADGYSTEAPERLHKDLAKKGYQASNRNQFTQQGVVFVYRQEAMKQERSYLAWRHSRDSDMSTLESANGPADTPPPILPHIRNPFSCKDWTLSWKIAKNPHLSNQTIDSLISKHGATQFDIALLSAMEQLGYPEIARSLDFVRDGFDIWTTLRVALPRIKDLSSGQGYQTIKVAPGAVKGWRQTSIPAEFGTVLVIRDPMVTGVQRFQVAQVRAFFRLPYRFKQYRKMLAYVELFTPFKEKPDSTTGLYSVRRSMRRGARHSKVIPLTDILMGCHLAPNFSDRKDTWTTNNVLEKASSFYFNHFSSVSMYILVHYSSLFEQN